MSDIVSNSWWYEVFSQEIQTKIFPDCKTCACFSCHYSGVTWVITDKSTVCSKVYLAKIKESIKVCVTGPSQIPPKDSPWKGPVTRKVLPSHNVIMAHKKKLDESTAHRHLKSPQSLSGRSLHLTLVTKWPRSHMTFKIQILIQGHGQGQTHWSYLRPRVQINMFAFRFVAIGPVLVEIYKNSYFTLKIQGQGHSQDQIWWSHLRPRVQSMCLLFVLWQSDHFWQRYSQFHIWPWKFKVKVMSKVKPDGHIWGLEINRYVCFLFRGNRTIFDWDIAKSIFDLENSR